jgi:hypothetical protein
MQVGDAPTHAEADGCGALPVHLRQPPEVASRCPEVDQELIIPKRLSEAGVEYPGTVRKQSVAPRFAPGEENRARLSGALFGNRVNESQVCQVGLAVPLAPVGKLYPDSSSRRLVDHNAP